MSPGRKHPPPMRIGSTTITPVLDGIGRFAPAEAYAGTTETMWARHRSLLAPDGTVEMAVGGFLIRGAGDRLVLVDTGLGQSLGGFQAGQLLDSLAALGVSSEDVTDVLFTHLHFDHVGWASHGGSPVFGRATYRCHALDWHHFVGRGDHPAASGSSFPAPYGKLVPVWGRMEFWQADGPVLPGIDVLHTPGHTPGSSTFVISSGAERALLLGDVVHCPVELLEPEWEGIKDVNPALAARTRAALAAELAGDATPLAAAHFPGLAFGRILPAGRHSNWHWL